MTIYGMGGCLVGGLGELQTIFNTTLSWTNYEQAPVVYTTTKDYSILISLAHNHNMGHQYLTNYCVNYGNATVINQVAADYFCYNTDPWGIYNVAILTNVPKGTQIKAQANGSSSQTWLYVYAVE